MRSWIMMVTRPTVMAITDMPIRMAQTRRRRIARSMSAIWAEGSRSRQRRVCANLNHAE